MKKRPRYDPERILAQARSQREVGKRRDEAALARATAAHMSNTKWRKLFGALEEFGVQKLTWKFVREDRIFSEGVPTWLLEDRLGDVTPAPYEEFRKIDWVEIPLDEVSPELEARLAGFPLVPTDTGLRITGYSWPD